MGPKFLSTFRGSYFLEYPSRETAEIVVDYVTDSNIRADIRKLELNDERVSQAIAMMRSPDKTNPIKDIYIVEGRFQREPAQEIANHLGHNSHLIAVVLGYTKPLKGNPCSEIIPFTLDIKEEDTKGL